MGIVREHAKRPLTDESDQAVQQQLAPTPVPALRRLCFVASTLHQEARQVVNFRRSEKFSRIAREA